MNIFKKSKHFFVLLFFLVTLSLLGCQFNSKSVENSSASAQPTSQAITDISESGSDTDVSAAGEKNIDGELIPEKMLQKWSLSQIVENAKTKAGDEMVKLEEFLDGLDDYELKEAYLKAYALATISYRDCEDFSNIDLLREFYGDDYVDKRAAILNEDGTRIWISSGYLYESVAEAYQAVFVTEYSGKLIKEKPLYRYGKELFYSESSNVRAACYSEYSVHSQSDDEVIICETCYEIDETGTKTDNKVYVNENSFVKTDVGWKCSSFSTKQD